MPNTITVDYIEKYWPLPVEFKTYARHRPLAYWVPIELRKQTLTAYRKIGTRVRLRYRGPRAHSVGRAMPHIDGGTYSRDHIQSSQYCLLEDATHFTVYDYTGV